MRSMRISDLMTESPVCCEPQTPLFEAARLMAVHDCGELPVVSNLQERRLIGVITDRDICCRGVAQSLDPNDATVETCMSSPAVAVGRNEDMSECLALMRRHQIRRIPVVDEQGRICGIVSQADVAARLEEARAAEVVRAVSRKSGRPAAIDYRSLDGGR